ncbi:hypothetical protein HanOQP8_Chr15g0582601 [Helianthus annuus]|nr:hypothetical protein HanHA89_Chr15g0624631 [Helianthus annuus]KAJ0653356.1 hypothetical protein HanOQP8_Chr15g0582601 [Helianthus annuus]
MKRHWKITVKVFGHLHTVEDDQGNSYNYTDPREAEEGSHDEEMVDEEDETEPAVPRGPRQRYRRLHREISADVANFVNQRWGPSYRDFNRGQQAVFDNVSAGIGEGKELTWAVIYIYLQYLHAPSEMCFIFIKMVYTLTLKHTQQRTSVSRHICSKVLVRARYRSMEHGRYNVLNLCHCFTRYKEK